MVLPHITITPIPDTEPDATPDLWNTRYSEIDENFAAIDTAIESLSSSGTVDTLSATVAGHTAWITEHDTLIHSLSATLTALSETVALHIAGGGGGGGTVTLPATPTITSPAANATGMSLTQTITLSAFSNTDSDAYATTVAEISTTSDFATLAIPAITATSGASVAVPSGLSNSTTYYLRVKYTDSGGHASAYSSAVVFTTVALVATPTISYPSDLSTDVPITNLFVQLAQSVNIASVSFEIATNSSFSTGVISLNATGQYYVQVPDGSLTGVTTYYARGRYLHTNGTTSDWSPTISFLTEWRVHAPSVTVYGVETFTPVISVAIADFFNPDNHAYYATQFQVASDSLFTSITGQWSDLTGAADVTVPAGAMTLYKTDYYIRARYLDTSGHESEWSSTLTHRYDATPGVITITSPADNETGVSLTPQIAFTLPPSAVDGDTVTTAYSIEISPVFDFSTYTAWSVSNASSPVAYSSGVQPVTTLNANADYYIRAKAIDSGGHIGIWSTPIKFTTGAS